ncbi:hypothetical protein GGX14DRAFT_588145 [Mycena pura]|uniref:Uncharacterized protein n=1 Tax=Mycena pura TaxID=153505 RepID=A0AAD6XZD8_9AGAR|nr:hypothetical protein GGX14DRAFT_588145 [Mycena pura]
MRVPWAAGNARCERVWRGADVNNGRRHSSPRGRTAGMRAKSSGQRATSVKELQRRGGRALPVVADVTRLWMCAVGAGAGAAGSKQRKAGSGGRGQWAAGSARATGVWRAARCKIQANVEDYKQDSSFGIYGSRVLLVLPAATELLCLSSVAAGSSCRELGSRQYQGTCLPGYRHYLSSGTRRSQAIGAGSDSLMLAEPVTVIQLGRGNATSKKNPGATCNVITDTRVLHANIQRFKQHGMNWSCDHECRGNANGRQKKSRCRYFTKNYHI